jgi:hypothetical protein
MNVQTFPRLYTRQGCVVERKIITLPNGLVHEHVTLSCPPRPVRRVPAKVIE